MRDINILAVALAVQFGSAQRLADELRLVVRRDDLGHEVRGLYLPPRGRRRRALLLLAPDVTAEERRLLLTRALGHHFLRHRALPWYGYDVAGARFTDSRAADEAALFAREFEAAALPQQAGATRHGATSPSALTAPRA